MKRTYYVQAPGIVSWEVKRLTQKQVNELRKNGYIVE